MTTKEKGKDDDDFDDVSSGDVCIINTIKVERNLHQVYLNNEISSPEDYAALLKLLRNPLESTSQIFLYLNNAGGSLSTGMQLINAIEDCTATLICVIDAPIYSMATLLALACPAVMVKSKAFMMFHDFSGGFYGKSQENTAHLDAWKHEFKLLLTGVGKNFLTKKEINDILCGKDLYIHSNEMKKRFKKLNKLVNIKY